MHAANRGHSIPVPQLSGHARVEVTKLTTQRAECNILTAGGAKLLVTHKGILRQQDVRESAAQKSDSAAASCYA